MSAMSRQSPRTREARLFDLLHSTPEQLSKFEAALVFPAGGRQHANRPGSAPAMSFSSMATPKVVQRAMQDLDGPEVPVQTRMPLGVERRAAVPPSRPVQPHRRKGPRFEAPLTRESSQKSPPSVLPLERQYRRNVASLLEQIQGSRTPLSKVLCDMPGYISLPPSRQRELRELVGSEAAAFGGGNVPGLATGLAGQSVRQVLAALKLRDKSSLRIEMHKFDRKLQMDEMRTRMRGRVAAR